MQIDLNLFNYIHGFSGQYYWLDFLGHFLAKYLPFALILILFLLFIKDRRRYGFTLIKAIGAGFFTYLFLDKPLEMLIPRDRPFVSLDFEPLVSKLADSAFPSSHAAFFFAFSTAVYFNHKKLGIFFYICSFFIVLARIFTGLHWPSDILAGSLVGILAGLILEKIIEFKRGRN